MIPDYRNSPLADMGSWNVSQAKRFFESGMTRNGQEFVRNLFLKILKRNIPERLLSIPDDS